MANVVTLVLNPDAKQVHEAVKVAAARRGISVQAYYLEAVRVLTAYDAEKDPVIRAMLKEIEKKQQRQQKR